MTMLLSTDPEGAAFPTSSVPTNQALVLRQRPPLRLNSHAAPTPPLSLDPSRRAATTRARAYSRRCQRPSAQRRDVGLSLAALAGATTHGASTHEEVAAPQAPRSAHHLDREHLGGSDRILFF